MAHVRRFIHIGNLKVLGEKGSLVIYCLKSHSPQHFDRSIMDNHAESTVWIVLYHFHCPFHGRAAGLDAGRQIARVVAAGAAVAGRAEQIAQRAVAEKIERLVGDLELHLAGFALLAAAHGAPRLLGLEVGRGRDVARFLHLLDDLLDVGRIARDKLELRTKRVDIGSLIRDAVAMNRSLVEEFGHELAVLVPAEPMYLNADPARLTQVFGNLLNNACRYTPSGGRIGVTAARIGGDVVVRVQDNGIGIPADRLASIFDMFSQVDRSLERSQRGLGIGLHLVKRLVGMHGGSVTAHSDGSGKGSEIVVHLPLLAAASAGDTPSETPADAQPESTASPRRILVVDDNTDAAQALALLLEVCGHETHAVHDGVAALDAAERLRPDAILLDIGLPRLNGFEVCRRIREQPWGKDVVVIALTGWGQEVDRRRSQESGFDHHIVKPVEHATLVKLLERDDRG